jgi:hypothetical protein
MLRTVIGAAEDGDVAVFVLHGDIAGDVTAGIELPVALSSAQVICDHAQP